ncbi:M4 family metallopeptidase [Baekduia sp. Peel2402]|uniref:M4 family metallopeptidase n=1 Tax=Baekduia sp. Peel2402 TaxID=3458296 RepID=UPI00403E45ED
MNDRFLRAFGLGCALSALAATTAGAATNTSTTRFSADTAGAQTLVRNPDGAVSTAVGSVKASALGVASGASSTTVARAAVDRYASMLGLGSGAQLHQVASRADADGTTVAYDQVAGDVPVYDGRVLVRVAKGGTAIKSITSSIAQTAPTSAGTATISAPDAQNAATAGIEGAAINAAPKLVVYTGVPFGAKPATLAYVTDVRSTTRALRQLVVTDAKTGAVIDRLDRLEAAKNRTVYDMNGGTSTGSFARGEGDPATGDADVDGAYNGTGATYDYYAHSFGRDSYDDNGAALLSFVHYGVGYENAFWDGAEMVYGDGFAVLDVTAHELTHAVTERTAGLEYADQSGALNEALSDMAGWDVDPGDSTMGEDLPIGAIRDMSNPGAYGQPATASQYVCTSSDNGGVHTNSGIPNKVYANLVSSLGRATAAQVRYRAQTTYLTPQSGFADARAAFVSAAGDVGANATTVANAWQSQGVTSTWAPSC